MGKRFGCVVLLVLALLVVVRMAGGGLVGAWSSVQAALMGGTASCAELGSHGTFPDFKQMGATNDAARYEAWHLVNPPCLPSSWVPDGCSYEVIDGDQVNAGYTRYPYVYMDERLLPADLKSREASANTITTTGVQTVKCADGFREIWWDQEASNGQYYHEVSVVLRFGPWYNEQRSAEVPVGVHDPLCAGCYMAYLMEYGREDPHPRIGEVFVGQAYGKP